MAFLIDGYNLLHALGLQPRSGEPTGLGRARDRLLCMLHAGLGARSAQATVVFDAGPNAPNRYPRQLEVHGIHVRFSDHPDNADDLIEQLIGQETAPQKLVVVSDDHRIQRAGRRRRCRVAGCMDFMEDLDRQERRTDHGEETERRTPGTEAETRVWLDAFADLENSPEMKRLFDPFGFGDADDSV